MSQGNRLIGRLAGSELRRLEGELRPATLGLNRTLCQAYEPIESVYFLNSGIASAMTVLEDGSAIEVATIGNEGVVGTGVLFSAGLSSNRVVIQVAGDGYRMDAEEFARLAGPGSALRTLVERYNAAYQVQVSYSVACNGLHPIQQRCCRWLLTSQDRIDSDELPLTHEFLGVMLGVRRASVSDVLGHLVDRGLIQTKRGLITIIDRVGLEQLACECYRTVRAQFARFLDA